MTGSLTPVKRRCAALPIVTALAAAACGAVAAAPPTPPLPWQGDFATAVKTAGDRHRHLAVFFADGAREASRRFEEEGLASPLVREGLSDLVWVRIEGDDPLAERLGSLGPPTLMFVNPLTGTVLHRIGGWENVERLAREIVHGRRAIGARLTPGLEPVASRMFAFDDARAQELIDSGDVSALVSQLAPAAADSSRLANYLVASFVLPPGMVPDDVRFLAGSDCLVGGGLPSHSQESALGAARQPELADCCAEYPLPDSGLVLVPVPREQRPMVAVRITAPGCMLIEDVVQFVGAPPATAVQVRRYGVTPLDESTAPKLAGLVRWSDGRPAPGAIVRIDDWFPTAGAAAATVRTDAEGRFLFAGVPPGRWLLRAEMPGGEREQVVEVAAAGKTACELVLEAVTTVSLRWSLQTREFSQSLVGDGVRTGEATVSVASSRLMLARGTRVRTADYSDISLAQTPLADDETVTAGQRELLAALPDGTPVWYLLDAAYDDAFRPISGMHRETGKFDAIDTVRADAAAPAEDWSLLGPVLPQALAADRERNGHFRLVRGEPVRPGDVFTLRCVNGNCFAKLEVTAVTIVTPASPPPP